MSFQVKLSQELTVEYISTLIRGLNYPVEKALPSLETRLRKAGARLRLFAIDPAFRPIPTQVGGRAVAIRELCAELHRATPTAFPFYLWQTTLASAEEAYRSAGYEDDSKHEQLKNLARLAQTGVICVLNDRDS